MTKNVTQSNLDISGGDDQPGNPWARWGWLMAVVWLVFLIFPGIALTESLAPDAFVVLGWIGLASFAAAYVTGFVVGMRGGWQSPTSTVLGLFFAAIGCAALTIPAIGWESASFLPFVMAYAAYGMGGLWHWITTFVSLAIITVTLMVAIATEGAQPPWVLLGIVLMMAAVNTINTWLIGRSVAEDDLRMQLATSEERESIARDVHDLLGHSLTVIKLKSALASRLIELDPAAARSELQEIERITGEAISGVRSTVTNLRTQSLDEQLQNSASALKSANVSVSVFGATSVLSPAQSIVATWILREATTNILRHARATNATIKFEPGVMIVEDDGVGVQLNTESNGLRGMKERATASGATFDIAAGTLRGGTTGTMVSVTW